MGKGMDGVEGKGGNEGEKMEGKEGRREGSRQERTSQQFGFQISWFGEETNHSQLLLFSSYRTSTCHVC